MAAEAEAVPAGCKVPAGLGLSRGAVTAELQTVAGTAADSGVATDPMIKQHQPFAMGQTLGSALCFLPERESSMWDLSSMSTLGSCSTVPGI